MVLTNAQIADEKAWVDALVKAAATSPEEWASYYSDDAIIIRPNLPPIQGKAAILKFCKSMHKMFSTMKVSNVVTTIDEANNRIILTSDGAVVLAADSEKQVHTSRWAAILEKPLGVGEKKITRDEGINDPTAVFKRIMEIGLDVQKMAEELLA